MRFGDCTYLEIREKADAGYFAIIPTGCTEQQGPHLPVDFDTWFAETLMLKAVEFGNLPALVLPAIPFGPTPEHRNFGTGFIDIPQAVHESVYQHVLESLVAQGFRKIVIWQGCGGHHLQNMVAQFVSANPYIKIVLPTMPFYDIWCRIGDASVPSGHADSFTTSIMLYLRPQLVNQDKIRKPRNTPLNFDDPYLDFAQHSDTGVIGDPTHASAELGKRLWDKIVSVVAQQLIEFSNGIPYS